MTSNFGSSSSTSQAASPFNIPPQDARGIEQRISEFTAAWNQHDPSKMAACWMGDGDLINPMGRVAKGREQIEQLFRDEHQGPMKSCNNQMRVTSIRKAGSDLAFVDIDSTMTGMRTPGGQDLPTWKVHVVLFMCQDQGSWKILCARPYAFTQIPGTTPA